MIETSTFRDDCIGSFDVSMTVRLRFENLPFLFGHN